MGQQSKQAVAPPVVPMEVVSPQESRKRSRRTSTPSLISTTRHNKAIGNGEDYDADDDLRPIKIFRGATQKICLSIASPTALSQAAIEQEEAKKKAFSSPLELLPEDVVAHALSFLSSVENRSSIQCTSKQFQRISSTPAMMIGVEVGGDRTSGLHGIIQETDTPDSASVKLTPFAVAGNLEALYM